MPSFPGRSLGPFEFTDLPEEIEPVNLGRPSVDRSSQSTRGYQLWTQYRPMHSPPVPPPLSDIVDYRIDSDIRSDLSLSSIAKMRMSVTRNTRAIALGLSDRLRIRSATIDGKPVEVCKKAAADEAAATH